MDRNYKMDTLRSIAILSIIMIHVSAYYVHNGFEKLDINFWIGNIFDSFSRIGVPIFLLISGHFLLGRHESILEFYKKRINRIFIPIVFWSIFYSIYWPIGRYIFKNEWDINIKLIFHNIILGRPSHHMWYLFMIIGLYLVTPLINKLFLKSNVRQINKVGFILLLFGLILNIWNNYLRSNGPFILWFIPYLGYFILGYSLPKTKPINNFLLVFIYFLSCTLISILSYYTIIKFNNNLYFYHRLSPFVMISSLSVYIWFNQISINQNILSNLSKYTLGIYLIHAGILELINRIVFKNGITGITIVDIWVKFFIVLIVSFIVVYIISKIPKVKRII